MSDIDNDLIHYGIKGQRWGVRKSAGQTEKKQPKRSMTTSEKAGVAFTATLLAAYGTLTLAAIKM